MKILMIGDTGAVGTAAAAALRGRGHQVIGASRSSEPAIDTSDTASVQAFFAAATERGDRYDAIAVAAGGAPFKPLAELVPEDFSAAIGHKGIGQIAVVQAGVGLLLDGGSFTLVSGILSTHPVPDGLAATTANAVVDSFVKAAAGAMPRGIRINAVSPTALLESWPEYGPAFPGFTPVPGTEVGSAYVRSIEGIETGRVITVW